MHEYDELITDEQVVILEGMKRAVTKQREEAPEVPNEEIADLMLQYVELFENYCVESARTSILIKENTKLHEKLAMLGAE